MSEKEAKSEYENFFNNFAMTKIEYRQEPAKIFPRPKFDMMKAVKSLASGGGMSSNSCSMNEPISTIQRSFGESLRFRNLLDSAADATNIVDRLAYIAAFSVSICHSLCQGRNAKSFEAVVGETYEIVDPTDKLALICEQVSHNPSIAACHAENLKWELDYNLCSKMSFQLTKIKYDIDANLKYHFKNDNQIFTSDRPSLFAHDLSSENRWLQYKGDQTISHFGSKARVELIYQGCERYSKNNCIKGKIFDAENHLAGTVVGNYLTKLIFEKEGSSTEIVLWELDESDQTFMDFYSFKPYTLTLNDPAYPVECPTDTRFRPDIRHFENANFAEADRHKQIIESKQSENENTRKKQKGTYEPRWFKKTYDDVTKKDFFVYNHKYLAAKLEKNYTNSAEIFK